MGLATLNHVLVLTDDMDGTRDWYRDVLGFEVGERPPLPFPGHWLYLAGVPCLHVADGAAYAAHAATVGWHVSSEPDGAGPVDHLAFTATGYDAIVARLEEHDVPAIRNTIAEIGVRQLFVIDPNGIRIEVNVWPE